MRIEKARTIPTSITDHLNLTSDRRIELDALAKGLADPRTEECEAAEARLDQLVIHKEDIDYFLAVWNQEEIKRRKRNKVIRLLFIVSILLPVVFGSLAILFIDWVHTSEHTASLSKYTLLWQPAILVSSQIASLIASSLKEKDYSQRGLVKLFLVIASENQLGILIEALDLNPSTEDWRDPIRERIAALLPFYHYSALPPLDDCQRQTLLRELKKTLAKRRKWPPNRLVDLLSREVFTLARSPEMDARHLFTQADATFAAAVLDYFAQEANSGRIVPKQLTPLLTGFSHPRKTTDDTETITHWRPVQEAAENLRVQLNRGSY